MALMRLRANRQPERRRHRRDIRGVSIIAALAALASILIVFAVGFASFKEFATSQHAREDLIYSSTIRADLQFIYEQILTAESAARGFVITGEDEFLPPLRETHASILQKIQQVAAFAVERPEHTALLAELARLTDEEMRLLQDMVDARTKQGAYAATVLQVRRGKQIMDRIAATVQDVSDAEIAAIAARTREVRIVGQRTKETLITLLAAAIAVVCASTMIVIAHLIGRRRAEQALGDTLSRHRAILASAMDSIVTVHESGRIETTNPATSRLLGWTQEELAGCHLGMLFEIPDGCSEADFVAGLSEAARDGGDVRELVGRRKDGTTVPVDVAIGEMRASGGRSLVAILHDITERKRAEVMKNEFVSTVSHELRTPLTSIAGSLGLLAGGAAGVLPEGAQRLVTIASQNSRRLVRLINDILDIEKMHSASVTFARQPVALAGVAKRALEETSGYAMAHDVSLSLSVAARDTEVMGDSDRLMQVLTNLISNAVKFSPAGSAVTVRVTRGPATVRISVCDHGTGIPESFRGAIFTRFAQADNSDSRQRGGTGLGLAIAKEIVDRHQGTLTFETEMGVGTTFHMDLPARQPITAAAADAQIVEPQTPDLKPAVGRQAKGGPIAARVADPDDEFDDDEAPLLAPLPAAGPCADVLVVEDDLDSAAVLCAILNATGISADVAGTAAQALARARSGRYQAVLVDLTLPDSDGIGLIRTLRRTRATCAVPLMIVSARASPGGLAPGEAEALQILDWIEKPVDPVRLATALARMLPALAAAPPQRPYQVLHLDDDPSVLEVVRAALAPQVEVTSTASLAEARSALASRDFDAAILDLGLPGGSGLQLLPHLRRHDGEKMPVVVFSARDSDPALARQVDAMLTKSHVSLDLLAATVVRLMTRQAPPSAPAEVKR